MLALFLGGEKQDLEAAFLCSLFLLGKSPVSSVCFAAVCLLLFLKFGPAFLLTVALYPIPMAVLASSPLTPSGAD